MIHVSPCLRTALLGAVLCAVGLDFAAVAVADPIESGSTTVTFAKVFDGQLKADQIGTQTIKRRAGKVRVLTWPIAEGRLDPTTGRGDLRYGAAVRFHAGSRRVLLRGLSLDTTHGVLRGFVAGRSLAIASAEIRALHRQGSDIVFSSALRIRPETARLLNSRLRPDHPFLPGQRFADAETSARPAADAVITRTVFGGP